MLDADVVVVGCGPAGAAAAIASAQQGLRAIVVRDEAAGQERPGETLHPGIETLFRALGVREAANRAALVRHTGHWTQSGSGRRFLAFGGGSEDPWRGYQIRRGALLEILSARAKAVGACVKDRCRALRPIRRGRRITGVETPQGAISCRFLVDASGGAQWLARADRREIATMSRPLIAWYGWAASEEASRYREPVLSLEDDGWCWIAQIADDICAWTRLGSGEKPISRLAKPRALNGFTELGREHGADVTWRCVARQAGPGFLHVGDAGAVLDPASSHGVLRALMTGLRAAHCMARILRSAASERGELRNFDAWSRGWFLHDVERLRAIYGQMAMAERQEPSSLISSAFDAYPRGRARENLTM
jgi:flavin-dependent dehydrogenase